MCGIAGFILKDGARPDPAELARMGAALAHRGPDDQGVYRSGPVGLVQTRLSIIGLESGHQPMVSEDGRARPVRQRRGLQLSGAECGAARPGATHPHRVGLRVYTPRLCRPRARLRRAPARDVRLRPPRRPGRPADPRTRPTGHQATLLREAPGSARLRFGAQGAVRDPARTPGHRAARAASVPREPVRHGRGDAGLRDPPGAPGRATGGGREPRDAPPALLVGPGCATPRARRATRRARSSTPS